MSVGKLVWALVSCGLAFGLNLQLKPIIEPQYSATESSTSSGTLTLRGVGEIPITTVHLTAVNVEHLGKVFKLRELMLRTPPDASGSSQLELYASLPEQAGDDLVTGPHDPTVFRQVELPMVPVGRLGRRPSHVLLAHKRIAVVLGTLTLTDVEPADEDGASGAYHVHGRVELQVERERGIDLLSGTLDARLIWDAGQTPAPLP